MRIVAEVLLPIVRVRLLVMPQMRRAFSLSNKVADGTIRSPLVVFVVVCRSGWIPIPTRS